MVSCSTALERNKPKATSKTANKPVYTRVIFQRILRAGSLMISLLSRHSRHLAPYVSVLVHDIQACCAGTEYRHRAHSIHHQNRSPRRPRRTALDVRPDGDGA